MTFAEKWPVDAEERPEVILQNNKHTFRLEPEKFIEKKNNSLPLNVILAFVFPRE